MSLAKTQKIKFDSNQNQNKIQSNRLNNQQVEMSDEEDFLDEMNENSYLIRHFKRLPFSDMCTYIRFDYLKHESNEKILNVLSTVLFVPYRNFPEEFLKILESRDFNTILNFCTEKKQKNPPYISPKNLKYKKIDELLSLYLTVKKGSIGENILRYVIYGEIESSKVFQRLMDSIKDNIKKNDFFVYENYPCYQLE